jgi:hypothetical protein
MAHASRQRRLPAFQVERPHSVLYHDDVPYVPDSSYSLDLFLPSGRTTHNRHVAVPWAQIMKNPNEYFHDGDTPDGIIVKDPSKMRVDELQVVRRFWKSRQDAGKPAFRFKTVLPKHQREERRPLAKGKGKAQTIKTEDDVDDIYQDLEEPSDDIANAAALSKMANCSKVGESSR